MFTLSPQQMKTLDDQAEERYVARLAAFVREECPNKDALRPDLIPADELQLRSLVRQRLNVARGYGLSQEDGLACFVALSFSLAHNFDEAPQFQAVLTDARMRPEARMERAFQMVIQAEAQRGNQV